MILVENQYKDGTSDYVFPGAKPLVLKAGATGMISEAEWSTIPFGLRGPGGINPVTEEGEVTLGQTKLDYYTPDGDSTAELRYQGTNVQDADSLAETWTIRRFTYEDDGSGQFHITEVQTLQDVAWGADTAARDALAWT